MAYMNTGRTLRIESSSSDATFETGKRFGSLCKGGEVIVLTGDLGSGKTTLTKGLAAGLGCLDNINSPTFTVSRVHACRDGLYLHHFDFYRLREPGLMTHDLTEVIDDPAAIVVVEWADIVEDVLPGRRLDIRIEQSPTEEDGRVLHVDCPAELSYLTEEAS